MQRNQKLVSLIYLACGFVAWLISRELFETVWAVAKIKQPVDWILSPSDILAIVVGIVTFIIMIRIKTVSEFTNDTITELGKVTWPKRKETVLSTGVVSVLIGIASAILFGFDMIWGAMVNVFYH